MKESITSNRVDGIKIWLERAHACNDGNIAFLEIVKKLVVNFSCCANRGEY